MSSTYHQKSKECLKLSASFFLILVVLVFFYQIKGNNFSPPFVTSELVFVAGMFTSSLVGLIFSVLSSSENNQMKKERLFIQLAHVVILFILGSTTCLTFAIYNVFQT